MPPSHTSPLSNSLLTCQNLSIKRGSHWLYQQFTHEFSAPLTWIIGSNGSGKTTLLTTLAGIHLANMGDIFLGQYTLRAHRNQVQSQLAWVPDKLEFYALATGRECLQVVAESKRTPIESNTWDWIERYGLVEAIDTPISGYSYGMKKKLTLAAATIGRPDYVLMDEPTNGLDKHSLKVLKKQMEQQPTRFIIASHESSFIEALALKKSQLSLSDLALERG